MPATITIDALLSSYYYYGAAIALTCIAILVNVILLASIFWNRRTKLFRLTTPHLTKMVSTELLCITFASFTA